MRVSTPTKYALLILSGYFLAILIDIIGPAQYCAYTERLKESFKRLLIRSQSFFDDDPYYVYDEYNYVDFDSGLGCKKLIHRVGTRIKNMRNRIMSAASEQERRDIEAALKDEDEMRKWTCISMIGNYMPNYVLIYGFAEPSTSSFTINRHLVKIESASGELSYRVTSGRLLVKEGSDVGWGWSWLDWSSWGWGSEEVVAVITWWGWWKVQADGITVFIKLREATLIDQLRAYKTGAGQLDIRFPA